MEITYSPSVDAAYIRLVDAKAEKTLEISADVLIDLDAGGNIIGIELLNVAAQRGLLDSLQEAIVTGIPVIILPR